MRYALALILASVLLCGCGSTPPPLDAIQSEVKTSFDAEVAKKGIPASLAISLVDADGKGHNYEGFADMPDGTKIMLKVTRQDDGQMIWKVTD
jgi:uncharacterized protein YcfL